PFGLTSRLIQVPSSVSITTSDEGPGGLLTSQGSGFLASLSSAAGGFSAAGASFFSVGAGAGGCTGGCGSGGWTEAGAGGWGAPATGASAATAREAAASRRPRRTGVNLFMAIPSLKRAGTPHPPLTSTRKRRPGLPAAGGRCQLGLGATEQAGRIQARRTLE